MSENLKQGFRKVRFYSKTHGATAGLVIDTDKHSLTIGELSRLFPVSEFRKMDRLQASPKFSTWEKAFAYEFKP